MTPSDSPAPTDSLDQVRTLLSRSTQQLLGATIDLDDDRWREPSRLPGWSRGHVGSHLARNAEAIGRLAGWALTGDRQDMYPSAEQRDADIEAGAGRPGLELQVDLDTTAGALGDTFARLDEAGRWDQLVEVRGERRPARLLPLFRLAEVVLHHIDLDVGFAAEDVDEETSTWLLEYVALRLHGRADFPRLDVRTGGGFHAAIGSGDDPRVVTGTGQQLLGWLTGRPVEVAPDGTEGIQPPAFG